MGLSARDRQALTSIESQLAESDPDLAARMAAFSRFADGADMPMAERIRVGWRQAVGSLGDWFRRRSQSQGYARTHSLLASTLMACWLVFSCGLIATAVTLSHVVPNGQCAALAVKCGSHIPVGHNAPHPSG